MARKNPPSEEDEDEKPVYPKAHYPNTTEGMFEDGIMSADERAHRLGHGYFVTKEGGLYDNKEQADADAKDKAPVVVAPVVAPVVAAPPVATPPATPFTVAPSAQKYVEGYVMGKEEEDFMYNTLARAHGQQAPASDATDAGAAEQAVANDVALARQFAQQTAAHELALARTQKTQHVYPGPTNQDYYPQTQPIVGGNYSGSIVGSVPIIGSGAAMLMPMAAFSKERKTLIDAITENMKAKQVTEKAPTLTGEKLPDFTPGGGQLSSSLNEPFIIGMTGVYDSASKYGIHGLNALRTQGTQLNKLATQRIGLYNGAVKSLEGAETRFAEYEKVVSASGSTKTFRPEQAKSWEDIIFLADKARQNPKSVTDKQLRDIQSKAQMFQNTPLVTKPSVIMDDVLKGLKEIKQTVTGELNNIKGNFDSDKQRYIGEIVNNSFSSFLSLNEDGTPNKGETMARLKTMLEPRLTEGGWYELGADGKPIIIDKNINGQTVKSYRVDPLVLQEQTEAAFAAINAIKEEVDRDVVSFNKAMNVNVTNNMPKPAEKSDNSSVPGLNALTTYAATGGYTSTSIGGVAAQIVPAGDGAVTVLTEKGDITFNTDNPTSIATTLSTLANWYGENASNVLSAALDPTTEVYKSVQEISQGFKKTISKWTPEQKVNFEKRRLAIPYNSGVKSKAAKNEIVALSTEYDKPLVLGGKALYPQGDGEYLYFSDAKDGNGRSLIPAYDKASYIPGQTADASDKDKTIKVTGNSGNPIGFTQGKFKLKEIDGKWYYQAVFENDSIMGYYVPAQDFNRFMRDNLRVNKPTGNNINQSKVSRESDLVAASAKTGITGLTLVP